MKNKTPKLLNFTRSERAKKAFYFVAVFLLLILLWGIAAVTVFKNNPIVPTPAEVFALFLKEAVSGKLWLAVWNTLFKSFLGFVVAFIAGTGLAILANRFARAKYCIDPVVTLLRAFPTLGVTYLLLMWLKTPETAVVIGVLVIFPLFYTGVLSALQNIDRRLLQTAKVYRLPRFAEIFKIYLPGAAAPLFAVVLSAFALNLKVVIAAEIVGGIAPNTVGNFMSAARSENNYAAMFMWVLTAVVVAFIAEAVIKAITRLCMPWQYDTRKKLARLFRRAQLTQSGGETAENTYSGASPRLEAEIPPAAPPVVSFGQVTFSYPAAPLFKDFSLSLAANKIHCIFGPSGCGKTTLLHLAAGLVLPQKGTVGTDHADISYLFQEPRLIPQRTVLKNLTLVLEPALKRAGLAGKEAKNEARARATELLAAVGLSDAAQLYPRELSGGMAQRAALARAFCFPSRVLLMDEPFKGLDYRLQRTVRNLFLALLAQHPKTVLLVTHDPWEAVMLADAVHAFSSAPPVSGLTTYPIDTPRESRSAADPDLIKLREELIR